MEIKIVKKDPFNRERYSLCVQINMCVRSVKQCRSPRVCVTFHETGECDSENRSVTNRVQQDFQILINITPDAHNASSHIHPRGLKALNGF